MTLPKLDNVKIGIIGMGYVGLPLAVYLARKFPVVGFDINAERIGELSKGLDRTREVTAEEMRLAKGLKFSCEAGQLAECNFFIVTVPTPIDEARRPDLTALEKASATICSVINPGSVSGAPPPRCRPDAGSAIVGAWRAIDTTIVMTIVTSLRLCGRGGWRS